MSCRGWNWNQWRRQPSVDLIVGQCRRHWPTIKSTLGQFVPAFTGPASEPLSCHSIWIAPTPSVVNLPPAKENLYLRWPTFEDAGPLTSHFLAYTLDLVVSLKCVTSLRHPVLQFMPAPHWAPVSCIGPRLRHRWVDDFCLLQSASQSSHVRPIRRGLHACEYSGLLVAFITGYLSRLSDGNIRSQADQGRWAECLWHQWS